jgi:cytochrome c-type biogenesis protein CcmH/NrfG
MNMDKSIVEGLNLVEHAPVKAEAILAQVVAKDPSSFDAQLGHGAVLSRLGRRKDAIKAFEAACKRMPTSQTALLLLATHRELDHDFTAALDAWLALENLNPNNEEAQLRISVLRGLTVKN